MPLLSKSKIKICGIKNLDTLDFCIKNKVNYYGLIFYKTSPRNISIKKAKKLLEYSKNKKILSVGVFVDYNLKELSKLLKNLNFDYIQLHGKEDDKYIKYLKEKNKINVIKVISIKNLKDFKNITNFPNSDMFLFDYKPEVNELPGGNSKKFDWKLLKNIKINKPWFISGGINENNIMQIKNYVIPYGIDISSGVEVKRGMKSNQKIKSIVNLLG